MAVTRWRPLEEYHLAVRLLVRFMWRQEPPLLPSGFADLVGLPRQLISRWLQLPAEASAEPLPSLSPPEAVRLSRAIGVAPCDFLQAAALATEQEPLFAREDAWAYVLACVTAAQEGADGGTGAHAEGSPAPRVEEDPVASAVRAALEVARAADLARLQRT